MSYRSAITKADAELSKAERAVGKTSSNLAKVTKAVEELRSVHRQKVLDAVTDVKNPPPPLNETEIAARLQQARDAHLMASELLKQAHTARRVVLADHVDEINDDAITAFKEAVAMAATRLGDLTAEAEHCTELQQLSRQAVLGHNLTVGSDPAWSPNHKPKIEHRFSKAVVTVADIGSAAAIKARRP